MTLDKVGEGSRWIDQLVQFYKKIVEDPNLSIENLDKANDAILRCIEELRPLTEVETDDRREMDEWLADHYKWVAEKALEKLRESED